MTLYDHGPGGALLLYYIIKLLGFDTYLAIFCVCVCVGGGGGSGCVDG